MLEWAVAWRGGLIVWILRSAAELKFLALTLATSFVLGADGRAVSDAEHCKQDTTSLCGPDWRMCTERLLCVVTKQAELKRTFGYRLSDQFDVINLVVICAMAVVNIGAFVWCLWSVSKRRAELRHCSDVELCYAFNQAYAAKSLKWVRAGTIVCFLLMFACDLFGAYAEGTLGATLFGPGATVPLGVYAMFSGLVGLWQPVETLVGVPWRLYSSHVLSEGRVRVFELTDLLTCAPQNLQAKLSLAATKEELDEIKEDEDEDLRYGV